MTGKTNITSKILKILAKKPATSIESIKEGEDTKSGYSINRSIKNLLESGHIAKIDSDNKTYLKLTKKGQTKLDCMLLEGDGALMSTKWDGYWRIIILDLPEERKSEREALRYLLKKANFVYVKNTVWVSPYPYENLFTNIKKDLNLTTEMMIIVTDKIDEETRKILFENLKKSN